MQPRLPPDGPSLRDIDLDAVEQRLGELCGFRFGAIQRRSLEMAIARRMSALGDRGGGDYVARIVASGEGAGETAELLGEFTNTETHFFRHAGRFRLLREQVVDGLLAHSARRSEPIRVLSAGCSSGEEVYSSIITLLEPTALREGAGIEVLGCDINRRALDRARLGRYGRWSLRYTDPAILRRYFQPAEEGESSYEIGKRVRRHATFRWANLLRLELGDAAPVGGFDVIFCCNVLIYMSDPAIARIMANLRELLSPEGYLFLGYAESLQGARNEFDAVQAGDYVVYRRKAHPSSSVARRGEARPYAAADERPPVAPAARSLETAPPPVVRVEPVAVDAPRAQDADRAYARARAALDEDRQQAALTAIDRLLEASPFHLGARLLKGYIRGSQGDFLEAAAECTKVLDVDPCTAEAYLLRAMLLRQAGDVECALGEVKKALFLEPDLALAQYLLGQLHSQCGEVELARQAYANAARTLRTRPDGPIAVHVPFELGRRALLNHLERALATPSPSRPARTTDR